MMLYRPRPCGLRVEFGFIITQRAPHLLEVAAGGGSMGVRRGAAPLTVPRRGRPTQPIGSASGQRCMRVKWGGRGGCGHVLPIHRETNAHAQSVGGVIMSAVTGGSVALRLAAYRQRRGPCGPPLINSSLLVIVARAALHLPTVTLLLRRPN